MLQWLDSLPIDRMVLLVGCVLAAILLMVMILATGMEELFRRANRMEQDLKNLDKALAITIDNVIDPMRRDINDLARQDPPFYDELAEVDWVMLIEMIRAWKSAGLAIDNYGTGNEHDPRVISEARASSGETLTVAQTHGVVAEPPRPGILVSEVQGLWDATKLALDAKATERHGYHNEDVIPFDVARAEDDGMGWQRPGVE